MTTDTIKEDCMGKRDLLTLKCHKSRQQMLRLRYVYANLAGIKPIAREIPHFSENFIYLSPPVSLKLGQGLKI